MAENPSDDNANTQRINGIRIADEHESSGYRIEILVVLLANTAPVALGAIASSIITATNLTGIPYTEIGAYVGRETSLLAAMVPLLLATEPGRCTPRPAGRAIVVWRCGGWWVTGRPAGCASVCSRPARRRGR